MELNRKRKAVAEHISFKSNTQPLQLLERYATKCWKAFSLLKFFQIHESFGEEGIYLPKLTTFSKKLIPSSHLFSRKTFLVFHLVNV